MFIEKELIEKAKEKLGDENAFVMVELLDIENFDEKNLKACCPYHREDTASFIYNRKAYNFHCFGCGKTVDTIDALMENGNTFVDAVKKLCKKAELEFNCPEQHVRTLPRYKYPHEESRKNDMTKVYEYLNSRGISKATTDYLDIRSDENGNVARIKISSSLV